MKSGGNQLKARKGDSKGRCFSCDTVGYYANERPSNRMCSLCGATGHVAKSYPDTVPSSALAEVLSDGGE